jgi:hypothetical protein
MDSDVLRPLYDSYHGRKHAYNVRQCYLRYPRSACTDYSLGLQAILPQRGMVTKK